MPAPGGIRDSVKLLKRLMETGLETGLLSVNEPKDT